jgi:serine/threonine protein phosphatase 1
MITKAQRRIKRHGYTEPCTGMLITLPETRRIWAVGPAFGRADRLKRLHLAMADRLADGDAIVYLGNYLGHGDQVTDTVDELLAFRRQLTVRRGWLADNVACLRGAQEEMWVKLLQIQWAMRPEETFAWMMANGVDATLRAYGGDPAEAPAKFRSGVVVTTRWTTELRETFTGHPGHYDFIHSLASAARTADGRLLFTAAGLDPRRDLEKQNDLFWWSTAAFEATLPAYGGFTRIVRGYDKERRGPSMDGPVVSLDNGGDDTLLAVCLTAQGSVDDRIDA